MMISNHKRYVARRWPFGAHTNPPMPPMGDPGLPGAGDPVHPPMGEPPLSPEDPGQPIPTPVPPHTPIAPPGIPVPNVTRRCDH